VFHCAKNIIDIKGLTWGCCGEQKSLYIYGSLLDQILLLFYPLFGPCNIRYVP
jgi:hypothetical protein